jgi:hypothetical protein
MPQICLVITRLIIRRDDTLRMKTQASVFLKIKILWPSVRRLCLVGRYLGNPTVCTHCVCRRTRVDTVCSRKVDEWGQALGAPEVISNVLIDWSLRVRRELSDAVTSAASIHADNVILHIHPATAQAVTPFHPPTSHPQSTQHILIKLK